MAATYATLNFVEEAFYPRENHVAGVKQLNIGFNFAVERSKGLTPSNVEIAIRRAAAKQYRLCCCVKEEIPVGEHWRRTPLVACKASELPINLRILERNASRDEIRSLIEYELNTEHIRGGLLWRTTVFLGEEYTEVVMGVCHGIADGLSTAIVSHDIDEELEWVIQNCPQSILECDMEIDGTAWPDYSKLPFYKIRPTTIIAAVALGATLFYQYAYGKLVLSPIASTHRDHIRISESKRLDRLRFHPVSQKITKEASLVIGLFPNGQRGSTIVDSFELTKEETSNLHSAAKEHHATVTGGIIAAAFEAYLKTADSQESRRMVLEGKTMQTPFTCSMGGRELLAPSQRLKVGNTATLGMVLNSSYNIKHCKDSEYFWGVGQRNLKLAKLISRLGASAGGIMVAMLLSDLVQMENSTAPLGPMTFAIANLGLAIPKLFAGYETKEPLWAFGCIDADSETGVEFNLSTVTVNEKLFGMISANELVTSNQRLELYVQNLKESLQYHAQLKRRSKL